MQCSKFPHSITSSICIKIDIGTSSPSVFAFLLLITSATFFRLKDWQVGRFSGPVGSSNCNELVEVQSVRIALPLKFKG